MPLSELEQRLCRHIAPLGSTMLADLAAHVAVPTGHNFTQGLDEYRGMVLERLKPLSRGIESVPGEPRPEWLDLPSAKRSEQSIPPVAIVRARAHASGARVLIAGHLDTVHDPFGSFKQLSVSSDRQTCIGPGAVDMKGGILVAITALEALASCGVDVNWTFTLNSDEETGSFHSISTLEREARSHDIGVVLEPALPGGALAIERMGSGQFKIETFGRSAHVGRDFEQGVSAVTALAKTIVTVAEFAQPEQGRIVNVGPLAGGLVTNAVPDRAACWGNVRFANEHSARVLESQFDGLVSPLQAMPRVQIHRAFNRPAKPSTPQVMRLAEVARDAARDLQQELPFTRTGGVCDGNILQAQGLPTLDTMGVRGGNLHRENEFVEVASLVERSQLLAVFLVRAGSNLDDA